MGAMIKKKKTEPKRLGKDRMIQFRSKMNKYLELALGIPDALVYMLAQAGSDDMHLIMDRRSTASLTVSASESCPPV